MTRWVLIGAAHGLGTATVLALASCDNPSPDRRTEQRQPLVVLSLTDPSGGPIKGLVSCEDKDARALMDEPCLADATTLARSVLLCGPIQASIDMGGSHVSYVYFPSSLRDMPKDIDVVRCVQRRVGFRFAAGISSVPPADLDASPDDQLFKSLHSNDASPPLGP